MRILIDARFYGLENAGLGRYTINLLEELEKIDKQNDYFILLREKYFNQLNYPGNWKKVLADYPHYTLTEQIKLPLLIAKYKPDLCHFLHLNVPSFYNGKYVVTIHDILMNKQKGLKATTLLPHLYYLKRLGYKFVFWSAVRNARKIIVPSSTVKKEVLDYYKIDPIKIAVTYEGVDEKISKDNMDEVKKYNLDSPYFLYVGNAYPHKNLNRVVEAVILLNKQSKKKILFAISSSRNIFVKKLEKLIDKLEAGNYVRLLGFVPDKNLASLYQKSIAFVFPSTSEGFGLPGLEAMASGTLTLASNIPVFREIYKDAAIYFDPFDTTSIKQTMQKVINMKESERKKMIEYGKRFAKRYSWSKMAKETLKVYKEVLETR